MDKNRRIFIRNLMLATGGAMATPAGAFRGATARKTMKTSTKEKNMFVGVQVDKKAYANRSFDEIFDEMQNNAPINSAIYFFRETDVKLGKDHNAGTEFRVGEATIDKRGRDNVDQMQESASKHNIDLYMGGGEVYWFNCNEKYPQAAQVDCYGKIRKYSCVNKADWRKFQMSVHADIFSQHPYLTGFLFMHERHSPLLPVFFPGGWLGEFNPGCFCPDCCRLGESRGINVAKAREGFKALVNLYKHKPADELRDGAMVAFWRIISEYPEIMAWEKLQWDSFHSYRMDIAKAIREAKPEVSIGYHFQHNGLSGNLPWRAGDDPSKAKDFADWIKPSIYPGCSGRRYYGLLKRSRKTFLMDLNEQTAHDALSEWFNRSSENGQKMLDDPSREQSAFTPEWALSETKRFTEGAAPLPNYAGLGIGIPGGEKADTPELISACTEACFKGGAKGIMISRHYSEVKPKLLKAAGDVIKKYMV
jgi:hypothetical protein